nr:amidohydrolase family protein [uncultured Brevundimonas sp.]
MSGAAAAALVQRPAYSAARIGGLRRTLIKGADLLSMDARLGEIFGADILLQADKVVQVGRDLPAGDAAVIDGRGKILMPGMADGHRHVWECAEIGRLVKTNIRQFAAEYQLWKMKWMPCATAEDHYFAAYYGGLQAIDSGVTALIDHAHAQYTPELAVAAARGLKDSGVAGWYAHQVSHSIDYGPGDTIPLAHANRLRGAFTSDEHWVSVRRVQDEILSDQGAPLQLGVALSNGSKGQPLEVIGDEEIGRARHMGIRLITHHASGAGGHPAGHFGHRETGIRDLYEAGLLGPDIHCSHGVTLSADELDLLHQTGGMVCPTCIAESFPSRPMARRDPCLSRARKAGVKTGMGIDVPLALTGDYFEHIRAAFLSLYAGEESEAAMADYTSKDMLDFATRGGYDAMRLGDVAGSIAEGRRADLVLLDMNRAGAPMAGSLADRVVNFAARSDIDSVWVAGRLLKSGGRMVGVDWRTLNARMAEMQTRIHAQAQTITFT